MRKSAQSDFPETQPYLPITLIPPRSLFREGGWLCWTLVQASMFRGYLPPHNFTVS